MIRSLILCAVMMSAAATGGCAWRLDRPMQEETTSVGTLERAERARSEAGRMHPDCRDERSDRRDQQDGCREVARRD